jgi:hypothetical protein
MNTDTDKTNERERISAPRQALRMIVIYHHARDYPEHNFVARQWWIIASKAWCAPGLFAVGHTLREVRAAVPPGFSCIPHQPGEDPVIIETWV